MRGIVSNVGNDVNARAVVNARARECAICHMRFSCNLKRHYVMLKDILFMKLILYESNAAGAIKKGCSDFLTQLKEIGLTLHTASRHCM